MFTVNGAEYLHTGPDGTLVTYSYIGDGFIPDRQGNWYRMQMLPIAPQRFKFIRKSNLRKPGRDE